MKQTVDLAVVVLSCDKYSDLWKPFFDTYFRFWGDITLPVYLCANRLTFDDRRVTTALSGEDPDWSTSVKESLKNIPHEYVLLTFDDVFFDRPANTQGLERLLDFLSSRKPTYLRFRPEAKPDDRIDRYFGRIREDTIYRTSIFGIWRRTDLLSLLKEGESAWQFEYNSPHRAREQSEFYGVYHQYFSYIHGVEKGLWVRSAYLRLNKLGVNIDTGRRRLMTSAEARRHKLGKFREFVFNAVPASLRPKLLETKRKLIRTLR